MQVHWSQHERWFLRCLYDQYGMAQVSRYTLPDVFGRFLVWPAVDKHGSRCSWCLRWLGLTAAVIFSSNLDLQSKLRVRSIFACAENATSYRSNYSTNGKPVCDYHIILILQCLMSGSLHTHPLSIDKLGLQRTHHITSTHQVHKVHLYGAPSVSKRTHSMTVSLS